MLLAGGVSNLHHLRNSRAQTKVPTPKAAAARSFSASCAVNGGPEVDAPGAPETSPGVFRRHSDRHRCAGKDGSPWARHPAAGEREATSASVISRRPMLSLGRTRASVSATFGISTGLPRVVGHGVVVAGERACRPSRKEHELRGDALAVAQCRPPPSTGLCTDPPQQSIFRRSVTLRQPSRGYDRGSGGGSPECPCSIGGCRLWTAVDGVDNARRRRRPGGEASRFAHAREDLQAPPLRSALGDQAYPRGGADGSRRHRADRTL